MATATQAQVISISDTKVEALCDVMENFRMLDLSTGYREWFIKTVRDESSYFGNSYEFTSRMDGIRIHIFRSFVTNEVKGATLSRDSENASFSQEMIDFGNELISEIFA